MTECAICGVSFKLTPIVATLRLQRRYQSTFQRWLFCVNCFGKMKIDLGELTYVPELGVIQNVKEE
jgi:hypothetical protein